MSKTIEVSEETYSKIKDQLGADEKIKEINSLEELIGETYLFQCARYIYHGEVKKITPDYIELKNAGVVFETGEYENNEPENLQKLPKGNVFVLRQAIESFYKLNW